MARDGQAIPIQGADTPGTPVPVISVPAGGFASSPTQVNSQVQGSTAAVTATMAAVAGKTNFVTEVYLANAGATAAISLDCVINGLLGGNLHLPFLAQANASPVFNEKRIQFNPPLPATGQNVAITVTHAAVGAGGTSTVAAINGYVA